MKITKDKQIRNLLNKARKSGIRTKNDLSLITLKELYKTALKNEKEMVYRNENGDSLIFANDKIVFIDLDFGNYKFKKKLI